MQYGKVSDFLRAKMKDDDGELSGSYDYYSESEDWEQLSATDEPPNFGKRN